MNLSPRAAAWILERLGIDSSLAGDLLEECSRGRSTFWYWKQVLVAIWTGVGSAILAHKLLALRAVATGCAVNGLWLFLWSRVVPVNLPATPRISLGSMTSLLLILLTQAVTGWVVDRTHRAHAVPMVLVFAVWLAAWYFAGSLSDASRLLVDSMDQPRFRIYLAWYFTPVTLEFVGLLLGGLAGAQPPGRRARAQE